MKTEAEIYLEYETAITQADSFARCAGELDSKLSSSLAETAGKTASLWKGEGAALFTSRCFLLQEKIEGQADTLRAVSETVRLIAQNIYEAEMRALEIAREDRAE